MDDDVRYDDIWDNDVWVTDNCAMMTGMKAFIGILSNTKGYKEVLRTVTSGMMTTGTMIYEIHDDWDDNNVSDDDQGL